MIFCSNSEIKFKGVEKRSKTMRELLNWADSLLQNSAGFSIS